MARFAPLYEVPIRSAEAEVRLTIDRRDKLGLDGPGAAARKVTVKLQIDSPAPTEQVAALMRHAERGCHAERSLEQAVPVEAVAVHNGTQVDIGG